jgi:CRP-like cAMP-binding protein
MDTGDLGRIYEDGDYIIRQGEIGDCMYVIQEGDVEVFLQDGDEEIPLSVKGEKEFIGEMALFDRDVRSASVRAKGRVRALTIDKKNLLRHIHHDPSMAFRLLETMSFRIRELLAIINRLKDENGN